MEGYRLYVRLSFFVIWMCWTRCENCHVNPECTCNRSNGSYVYCYPTCGPNTPRFLASSVHFEKVTITGRRGIRYIKDNSFQGLITKKLTIRNNGISDIPCTAWRGLEDALTSLSLDNNSLTSAPTCSLQKLSNLEYLSLVNNNISAVSTEDFRGLSSLSKLMISSNKVANIAANAFSGLTKLEDLTLYRNQITYLDVSAFRGLESLTQLDLRLNYISHLHPRIFSDLKQLRNLDLSYNNITSVDSTLFQDLNNLRALSVRNNRLCSLPEPVFLGNAELTTLFLDGNCLNSLHENLFQTNSQLAALHVERNDITNISPGIFRNLSNLITIRLQGNRLTQIDENIFGGSPNIRYVYLNNNSIHTLHEGSFMNLTNLRTLDLSQNSLKRIDSGLCINCSKLLYLSLSQNHIYFMHAMSLSNHPRFNRLNLDRNNLSSSSWTWLLKVISKVPTIRYLDLSHNPIHTVPKELFNLTKNVVLRLRNTSLKIVPDVVNSVTDNVLDLSFNKLKSFGTVDSPQAVISERILSVNLSYNNLKSLNIIPHFYSLVLDTYISLNHNSLQKPIKFTALKGYLSVQVLDLSCNHIQNVTQFPLAYTRSEDTQLINPCADSSNVTVDTLHLSKNVISFISPEACLGIVSTLDLSYNQLSVFGELMPSHIPSRTRLRYLYMSGNNIHQVSSDALVSLKLLHYLDFRFNNIRNLQFTEKKLKESSLRNAKFSGNPIKCDCSSVWLTNGSIPNKLDSVRCQSPASARGYLVYCYPLTHCPVLLNVSIADNTRKICEHDSTLDLSNLTVTLCDSTAEVFWTKTGPGKISGYKLELRELSSRRVGKTLLINPERSNTTVSSLEFNQSYNICLTAQLHGRLVSNEICDKVEITGVETFCRSVEVETFCAGVDVVIGLSVSMALCLITSVSLVVCALYKRTVSHQTESSPGFDRPQVNQTETTPEDTNMYEHRMISSGNRSNTEELYEDLKFDEYENPVLGE